MMQISFDERNLNVVSAIATMLHTIAGDPTGVVVETKTVAIGDKSVTTKTETPVSSGKDVPPPNDFGNTSTGDDLPPPEDDNLDADKMPWDGRINSKTKTKNADNTWKILRRPKVQFPTDELWKAFIETVKAELKGELPPPDTGTTTDNTPPEDEMSFPKLMKMVTGSGGKITTEMLQEVCDSYEVEKPSDLSKMDNKILLPAIYEELQEMVGE